MDWQSLAWRRIDERYYFLDLAADRYFFLDPEAQEEFVHSFGVSEPPRWSQPDMFCRPADWVAPSRSLLYSGPVGFSVSKTAKAMWLQHRVEGRLKRRGLLPVLSEARMLLTARTRRHETLDDEGQSLVAAFEYSRLLRSAASRCLTRSIALAIGLAGEGYRSHIVLGISSPPFAAHCWTQWQGSVLNESLEEVQRYNPILVV